MSSESDDENVIRYGTPLDPYDEDDVPSKRKFQQAPDQYAVDDHGRRRFHGAFTGGFSAGFGNTVGTPEGWTPATFKSSRSEKANFSNQRPEDFMDEEDRSEFGIAPRLVETKSEFSGQKRQRQQYHGGPIPGQPVLEQVIRAVPETAAARLLRAMRRTRSDKRGGERCGERSDKRGGERCGERSDKRGGERRGERSETLRETEPSDEAGGKVYGCYVPQEFRQDQETSSESESEEEVSWRLPAAARGRGGLGHDGLRGLRPAGGGASGGGAAGGGAARGRGKISSHGQAFGVGAFEGEDEDIYATEDMSHYDFAIGGAPERDVKKKTQEQRGGHVLSGFVRSSRAASPAPALAPPAPPRGFVPRPLRSRFEPTDVAPRHQGLGRHELTAEARGAMLGESQIQTLPTVPQGALPTQQTDTIDPITRIAGRNIDFASEKQDYISIKDSGKELTKVFKPFASNPQKQARYEMYLVDKNSAVERDGESRVGAWEKERELAEFEQAAKLYRPLTGAMGDRFTHASEPDDALNPLTAVAKSCINNGLATPEQIEAAKVGAYGIMTRSKVDWRPEGLVCKRFNVPEPGMRYEPKKDNKPKVSYSIFSYMEHSVHDKDSFAKEQTKFSGSKSLTRDAAAQNATIANTVDAAVVRRIDTANPTKSDGTGVTFRKRMTVAELFLKEAEKDLQSKDRGEEVTETIEKFDKIDLYKSIFLSDSEDEDIARQDDNDTQIGKVNTSVSTNDFLDTPRNEERNDSPPRGIFANIDFDELNSWRKNNKNAKQNLLKNSTDKSDESKDLFGPRLPERLERSDDIKNRGDSIINSDNPAKNDINEADLYGPKIPDNLMNRLEGGEGETSFKPVYRHKDDRDKTISIGSSSSSDSWVDINEVKKSKKKKTKHKKHKSKNKKSKRKKKDR